MSNTKDIILHFYRESPFSQKLAWLLNYKKVEYKVAVCPRLEPRPLRRPIDGGYRKTPVLQIGNHVYCDTKSAILALEALYPEPSFYPKLNHSEESSEGLARAFTMWVDTTLFMNVVSQLPVAVLDDAFLKDRAEFSGRTLSREQLAGGAPFMKAAIQGEFAIAEATLGSKKWLLDTETPSLADISLAMITFFLLNLAGEKFVQENLKVEFNHMQQVLGAVDWERTESMPKISEEEAIEVLKRQQDKEVDESFKVHESILPIKLGQHVIVTPLDTGKVPVFGTLVRSTVKETVIAYTDKNYGTVAYIHFPTIGFVVIPNVHAK